MRILGRFRVVAFVQMALLSLACSDGRRRELVQTADAPDGGATLPEAAPPVDASPPAFVRDPFDPKDEPVTCTGTPCAVEIAAGDRHFCVRLSDATVRCWGEGAGDPSSLRDVVEISAAGRTTCARLANGTVSCWGKNDTAQLGSTADPATFDEDDHPEPGLVALDELGAAVRVDVGHGSACAVLVTGKLACWGHDRAQLARGAVDPFEPAPYRAPGIAEIDAFVPARAVVGASTTLATTAAGEVWSWGALAGEDGALSGRIASVSPDPRPGRIASLSNVTSLAVSGSIVTEPDGPEPPPPPRAHACAVADGEVYCWGRSYAGALCTGLPDVERTPRRAPLLVKAWPQRLAVADELTCARMTDGHVECCGADRKGRLGTGTTTVLQSMFVPAKAFTGHAVEVATSNEAVCALVQGGTVECWGGNEHGELGRSAPDDAAHPSPEKVDLR